LAYRAAEHILEKAQAAIKQRSRFRIALSGGTTPQTTYELLASPFFAGQIDWGRVQIFWGDERCVGPEDPQSDFRMAKEALLKHVPLPPENIHRMEGELPPDVAAARYTRYLEEEFGNQTLPVFDLILLGLGEDGHTASLFPDSSVLEQKHQWVAANFIEQLHAWRLTLTYPVINAARQITFLVTGPSKAGIVLKVLINKNAELPAARVNPESGEQLWLLDSGAAGKL
jgi:6-phosphogluconolactonase